MSELDHDRGKASTPPLSLSRRQRAPTITIDTSAMGPNFLEDEASLPLQTVSDHQPAVHRDAGRDRDTDDVKSGLEDDSLPGDLRPASSFESKESRPISPHNISSPTTRLNNSQSQNFLSVPSARSRGNSVDSDDVVHSSVTSYGGDTLRQSSASFEHGEVSHRLETPSSGDPWAHDEEALRPDPGTELDFEVQDNRFAFSPGQLNKLLNPKSLGAFHALGGLHGLEKGLRSDCVNGLSMDEKQLEGTVLFEDATKLSADERATRTRGSRSMTGNDIGIASTNANDSFADRKRIFQDNRIPNKKPKSIFELAWIAFNDKVLLLLTVAAVISLALGIYQSVRPTDDQEARVQWVEGVAIMVAIIIVVVVGAGNDWQKERQFIKLNKKKEDRTVKVVRSGRTREISIYDILVGDVVHVEPGDMIPVDGIFISGHNVRCDESSATGESDILKKTAGDDVWRMMEAHENHSKLDPFILSGGKVTEGIGTFLVTAVGVNAGYGKIMMSLREDAQTTPLQSKLNVLAEYIAKLGLAAGLLLFVVTFIEFCVRLRFISDSGAKGQAFLNVFIVAVTIVVVAVPEGLPLAVTLALAFATTRMLKDNNLVRVLRACETMGNATSICSDKTGTLTQNKMSVVAGTIGTASRFGDKRSEETSPISPASPVNTKPSRRDSVVDDSSTTTLISSLGQGVKDLLRQSIAINTTAFETEQDGEEVFVGSRTDTALLSFARSYLAMGQVDEERAVFEVAQLIPFDSGRKCMATAVKIGNGKYRLFVKGASELMLEKCNSIILDPTKDLTPTQLAGEDRETLSEAIALYASRSLRTIGILFKDFEQWPPRGYPTEADDKKHVVFDKVLKGMVFLGIVGIQDPLRPGVTQAVQDCQGAGVVVRMVTGDNLLTAKAIAEECGIYTPGGVVMEGPKFRKLSKLQMDQTIPRLQVLARSSPDDKRILVKRLRDLGETVAVTGTVDAILRIEKDRHD